MLEDIRVLSGRRAYEYPADALRLTVLTTKPVLDIIQQAFSFQLAQVGTPMAIFGDVPGTIPPGAVFNFGLWAEEGQPSVPIRFLHIEPRRIVIDVGGQSTTIAPIYERLRLVVQEIGRALNISGEAPIIGEHEHIRDFSEITARCSWRLDALFLPAVRDLLEHAAGITADDRDMLPAPTLYVRPLARGEESPGGVAVSDNHILQLGSRLGTRIEDHVHYSGALLDSDAHLAYLKELDAALSE
jgi:hypothetical protein